MKRWQVTIAQEDLETGERHIWSWFVWPDKGQQMLQAFRRRHGKPVTEAILPYQAIVDGFDAVVMGGAEIFSDPAD